MAQRYAFLCDWLDPASGLLHKYQFFVYQETSEIELIDIKNKRHFLRKTKFDVQSDQLYIGKVLNIFARQMKITDYGDDYTRSKLQAQKQRTLAMIKPDAVQHTGKIIHAIQQNGFIISNLRMAKLSKEEAQRFYQVHAGQPFYEALTDFMSSGRVVAMELVADDAIAKWRSLLGPTDSQQARQQAPGSIRASFGTNKTFNAAHGSDAPETAAQEISFFFGQGAGSVGKCDLSQGTVLGLLKPHLMAEGCAGLLLDAAMEAVDVAALQMFQLDRAAAADFLEVYKGVLAPGEFNAMVDELTSGPCIALEVAPKAGATMSYEELHAKWRSLCGPLDPELARLLRPGSLRAQFGASRVRNGVHCTDLTEDGPLEVAYFFSILQQAC